MTIKFSKAEVQQLSMPDTAGLTFPNADWVLSWTMIFNGDTSGTDAQYIFSSGGLSNPGTIGALYSPMGVDPATASPGKITVFPGQGTNFTTASQFTSGAYVFVLQYTSSNKLLSLRTSPIRNNLPTDGTGVTTEFSRLFYDAPLDGGTNNSGGANNTSAASRFAIGGRSYAPELLGKACDQSLSRFFRYDGTLSDLEVAQLAFGNQIIELGKTPAWYIRMDSATDIVDRGILGNTVSSTGTLATGTNPGYGYISPTGTPVVPTTPMTTAPASAANGTGTWTTIGGENATVQVPVGTILRYGVDTRWYYIVVSTSSSFVLGNTTIGGDPADGTAKSGQAYKLSDGTYAISGTPTIPRSTIATPTISSPGIRVVTLGNGKDIPNINALPAYLSNQKLTTNSEMLIVEVYEDQTLTHTSTDWKLADSDENHYCIIRPVPGLDVKFTEAGKPLTYGSTGLQLTLPSNNNPDLLWFHIVFSGFRVRVTGTSGRSSLSTVFASTDKAVSGFRNCRILVDSKAERAFDIGYRYGAIGLYDNLVIFSATSTAPLIGLYSSDSWSNIERNTFVGLGGSRYAMDTISSPGVIRDNVFVNVGGMALYNSGSAAKLNNISNNVNDTFSGFTQSTAEMMVADPSLDFKPKKNGSLIGAASDNAVGTVDVLGVTRTAPANLGAAQTPAVSPDATSLVVTGALTATIGYPTTLRVGPNNELKDGQSLTLAVTGTNVTVNNPDLTLDVNDQYEDFAFTFSALGSQSVTITPTGTPSLQPLTFNVQVAAPVPADALIWTGDSTVISNTPVSLTIKTNRPLTSGQALTVTFSDGDGGTFSPSTVSLSSGTDTASVTYTSRVDTYGAHNLTATTTGSLTIPQATKVVTLTAPAPVFVAGTNVYSVGANLHFANMAAAADFLKGKDAVGTKASVVLEVYENQTAMFNDRVTLNTNETYNLTIRPAAGKGFAALNPNPPRWIPTTGIKLAFTYGRAEFPRSTKIQDLILEFPNDGASIGFVTNGTGDRGGLYRNILNVTHNGGSQSVFTGEYATPMRVINNIIFRSGGSSSVFDMRDSSGDVIGNTFYAYNGWSGSSMMNFGGFGANNNDIKANVFYNCGPTPITGLSNANVRTAGNFTNVALPTTANLSSQALTYSAAPFFQNATSDIRPATGGPLVGTGSPLEISTNDVFGQNYGYVPDAGAVQLAAATPLPSATLTTYNGFNGQELTLVFNTTWQPTGGTAVLNPDATDPENAVYNTGILTFPTSTTAKVVFSSVQPGNYTFVGTVTNAGGPGAMSGVPSIKVIGLDGQPVMPVNPSSGTVPTTPVVTSVTVTPATVSIAAGATQQFARVVNGTDNPSQGVTWSVVGVSGATGGSIDANGLFTGPTTSVNTQFTVKATSVADTSKFGTATVTVLAQVVVVEPTPVYPPANKVTAGVKYGPTGVEYTGTYVASDSASVDEIVEAVWHSQVALSIPKFLAIK